MVGEAKLILKETLTNRGTLDQVKARVRAEVFHALNDPNEVPPPMSNENMLINELILEYLEYNRYKYTESVLMAESGQSTPRLDRQFLTKELNLIEDKDSKSLPLIYSVLTHFTHGKPSHHGTSAGKQSLKGERSTTSKHFSSRTASSEDINSRLEEPVLLKGERT
ncbi:centrosomal protein 20-like isoform X2 [Antedon mediterranea]|uniref:centrosomal protein 20-like isoform X2 n=1 Tax=Antedon mediterranea TaxID=105859 RepID=UPI003AF64CB3